jgi:ribosomal protein S18 acetylase RimI-like enzyme
MRITSLGFRTDVALRAMEGAEVTDRGDYLVIRTHDQPDFWWGNFLLINGAPGPGQAGRWLARFAAEFPAARHVALGLDIAGDVEIPGDFAAAGLQAERSAVLTAARLRPPSHPNRDARIRPLDGDDDWRQSVDLARRCFGRTEPGDFDERRMAARRRLTRAGAGIWLGAFTDGRLLAQLGLFEVGDGYARYQEVETDPAARRQGLAGTLLWTASRYARDTSTFVIVADPAQAAIRIYQACGFTARQSQLSLDRPPAPEGT